MHTHRLPKHLIAVGLVLVLLVGCSTPTATPELPTTRPTIYPTSENPPEPTPTTHKEINFQLSEPGPYFPGKLQATFEFSGSEHNMTIWYPAIKPQGFNGTVASGADADTWSAPYPLLLTATIFGHHIAPHLASYGFVVAGVDEQEPSRQYDLWIIEYPLQVLAMLDQMSTHPIDELNGVYDSNNSGILGYSFSGYNTLALSGARLDPQFYLENCAQGPAEGSSPSETIQNEDLYKYYCAMAADWESFAAQTNQHIPIVEEDLWQPMTDSRIRAAMPMAAQGATLFGERGLAPVNMPVLMICGTEDSKDTDYVSETVYIFEHLGAQDKTLISFIGGNHAMAFDPEPIARIHHFATAFFGYHLQGRADYANYFSEEYVGQFPDLAWGIYKGK